jgi:hypothetical protein
MEQSSPIAVLPPGGGGSQFAKAARQTGGHLASSWASLRASIGICHGGERAMTTATSTTGFRPHLWTAGDFNAFFGFGTNILVNMLVLTGLLRFVIKMPDSIVFGRILPALGLMLCLSTFYYAYLAYRLALKTGRNDVCALPSGISVPHMFIVTFVIMLPITLKTNDPIKGWEAGLVWVFFQSFILMIVASSRRSCGRLRRAPRCSVRSRACRSPSSRCAQHCRCT